MTGLLLPGLLLLLSRFCSLSSFEICHGDVFSDGDCEPISEGRYSDLFPLQPRNLCGQSPGVKVSLS